MPSGGSRAGAGRPPKPAAQKILEGNPGRREIRVLNFFGTPDIPETPPEYLTTSAKDVYTKTLTWLKGIGCTGGIMPYHIEEYATNKGHWLECEALLATRPVITKDANGKAVISPIVLAAQIYLKQSGEAWAKIYAVVRESKLTKWDENSRSDDVMARLLAEE